MPAWRVSGRSTALLLFALALAIRLGHLYATGVPDHFPDAEEYVQLASTLWHHGVYGYEPAVPAVTDHALYPILISPLVGIFGPTSAAVPIAQCVLLALCAPLAWSLAARLGGAAAGWLAAAFSISQYAMFFYAPRYLTEALTGFLLVLVLFLSDGVLRETRAPRRRARAAALGGVFALTALTRWIALPLIAVTAFCGALHARGRRIPAAGTLASAFAVWCLVLAPFAVRDRLVSQDGRTRVEYLSPAASAYTAEYIIHGYTLKQARAMTVELAAEAEASGEPLPYPIRLPSWRFARHVAQRMAILMGVHPEVRRRTWPPPYVPSPHPLHHAWHYALFAGVAAALALAARRRDWRLAHTALLPLALLFGYALVHAIPRYQTPSFQAWSVPAGVGIAALIRRALAWGRARPRVRG